MEKSIEMMAGQLIGRIGMDAKRASILNTLRKSIGQMKNVSIENVSEKFGGFAMIVNVKNNKLQTIRKVSIISNDFTSGGEHYLCEISFMDENDNFIKTQMNELDMYLGHQTAEEVIGIILNLSRASSEKYLTRMKNYGEKFVKTLIDNCAVSSDVECPIDKSELKKLLAFLSLGSIGFPNQDEHVVGRVVNYVGNMLNMPITRASGNLFCLEEAMINGGIFFINEANRLTPYQSLTLAYAISKGELVTNDGVNIKADPKFRVIATWNGCKEINHSLVDRFASIMYLESAKEEEFVYA